MEASREDVEFSIILVTAKRCHIMVAAFLNFSPDDINHINFSDDYQNGARNFLNLDITLPHAFGKAEAKDSDFKQ